MNIQDIVNHSDAELLVNVTRGDSILAYPPKHIASAFKKSDYANYLGDQISAHEWSTSDRIYFLFRKKIVPFLPLLFTGLKWNDLREYWEKNAKDFEEEELGNIRSLKNHWNDMYESHWNYMYESMAPKPPIGDDAEKVHAAAVYSPRKDMAAGDAQFATQVPQPRSQSSAPSRLAAPVLQQKFSSPCFSAASANVPEKRAPALTHPTRGRPRGPAKRPATPKRAVSPQPKNSWTAFLQQNKGSGKSRKQLQDEYRALKNCLCQ